MRKISVFIILSMFILNFSLIGAKYDDAVPVIKKMTRSLETFLLNLEKADNAKAIAATLDNYSKDVLEFAPDVKAMMKKYPELKDEKNHPERLKPYTKKFEDLTKKLMKIYGKLGKYMDDPAVKEASKRWQKAMSSLDDKKEEKEGIEK